MSKVFNNFQMKQQSGEVAVNGTICYVPQQALILNATFKENIIFGLPLDKQRFETYFSFSEKNIITAWTSRPSRTK